MTSWAAAVPDAAALSAFVRDNTRVASPGLVPELRLHLATELTPLWEATEGTLPVDQLPPPFWAFCWPGGQALARHVLDHPGLVAGRRVLDFGAGCGIAGLAAARAGATSVEAAEIDPYAAAAIRLNAGLNDVSVSVRLEDLLDRAAPAQGGWDLILAADVCYERPMAARLEPWLRARVAEGSSVLIADPGRTYLPRAGLLPRGRYTVATSLELESRESCETTIWEMQG